MTPIAEPGSAQERVLIVDDEQHNVGVLTEMLANEGYALSTATSGEAALAAIAEAAPDLILLDVLMPGMNGFLVTRAVKENPDTKSIPIILITNLDDRAGKLRGLKEGAEDFLSKPVERAELTARVRNLLRLKAVIEEARAARDAAQEANRHKSLFLQTIGHELRTPLGAITSYAEILQLGMHGEINAKQLKDLTRILSATSYIQGLIGDLMTMARLERPRAMRMTAVELNTVLSEVEAFLALQAKAGGVRLSVSPVPEEWFVTADAERLQQILINLIANGIKFTPRDGSVHVSCQSDGSVVYVRVTDSGIGISPGDADRIFEPFEQVEAARTPLSKRGIGLGLAISRQLAREMRGDLTLEFREAVGSTFLLALPAAANPRSAEHATSVGQEVESGVV
jgi:two-component system, sensor histidine kinase and response regulator